MHKLPNLTKNRHGTWYIRSWSQGRETRQSLGTKDWTTAKLLACQYHLSRAMVIRKLDVVFPNGLELRDIHSDDDVARAQKLLDSPEVAAYLEFSDRSKKDLLEKGVLSATAASAPRGTKYFLEATDLYLKEKGFDNSAKTLLEKKSAFREFSRVFNDPDTNSVTREQAISYKSSLINGGFSELRINKVLGFLRDFFGYAANHNLYSGVNPFEKLNISRKAKLKGKVKSYQQFTSEDLKLIFEGPKYRTFLNKPNYRWLPILALYTGARLEELASLKLEQIQTEDGIRFLDITKGKNANSIRRVPIHQSIWEAGFEEYLGSVKSGNGQLFPELSDGKNGFSKNMSRRFGQYLDTIGITDSRKVFHSFRSTFINGLTDLSVHPAIIMAMVGHYEQAQLDFSSPHFQNYQQPKKLAVLKANVDKLQFPITMK